MVILDNKSQSEYYIETSDNKRVLINSEFLTKIQQNPTLQGQSRLFVIQKLLDVSDMDDPTSETVTEAILELAKQSKTDVKRKYLGLTVCIKGLETTKDFTKSPFIKVFAENFESKAQNTTIDKIISKIRKDLKDVYDYEE